MDAAQTVITFGKYNGKKYEFDLATDVAYCNWALKQMGSGGKMSHFQFWLRSFARKVTCECCNGSGLVAAI
jgi:hypothetical protein